MPTLPRSPRRRKFVSIALGVVAVPAIMVGLAGAAQAAEIVPIAEYVDDLVADTDADLLAVLTALLS